MTVNCHVHVEAVLPLIKSPLETLSMEGCVNLKVGLDAMERRETLILILVVCILLRV
jgi:hypothetical protein